jgi:hypothetical protein
MNELSRVLDEVRAKIAKYRGKNLSEANTKTALIDPVLRALGWPVGNLDEVSLEFRLKSSDDSVDYALLLVGRAIPIMLVEAKALGQSLDRWANQIMGYAGTCGTTWVVLTNGDEYRIYNASVAVPFEQKLFRRVQLSNPAERTEETLALLSKERIDDLLAQWQVHFADSQVHAAVEKLFLNSPESLSVLVPFVKQHVKGLNRKEIVSSLARLRVKLVVDDKKPSGGRASVEPPGDVDCIEFWKPIRTESNGLFAGKPADASRIYKQIRGIELALGVLAHECRVELTFDGENRQERRDNALKFLAAVKYPHDLRESTDWVSVRFRVLDKGIKDPDNWPEIREKLTQLGAEIYNKLKDSDV